MDAFEELSQLVLEKTQPIVCELVTQGRLARARGILNGATRLRDQLEYCRQEVAAPIDYSDVAGRFREHLLGAGIGSLGDETGAGQWHCHSQTRNGQPEIIVSVCRNPWEPGKAETIRRCYDWKAIAVGVTLFGPHGFDENVAEMVVEQLKAMEWRGVDSFATVEPFPFEMPATV